MVSVGLHFCFQSLKDRLQPPRPQPKVHQILLKTHKTTVALSGVLPTTTVAQLKKEVISALTADVAEDLILSISPSPNLLLTLESHNDIELSKQDKERGKPTGKYTVLDPGRQVRELGLAAWETLFIQFKDPETRLSHSLTFYLKCLFTSSTGQLLPVTVTLPSIDDDGPEDVPAPSKSPSVDPSTAKGKRKASDFSDDELDVF